VNPLDSYDYASVLVQPGGLVLDVGCGSGVLSERLCALGCSVVAIDRDDSAFERLGALGVETIQSDLETADLRATVGKRQFDAIALLDVLEHVRDPEALLRTCKGVLAPHGVIIASIPNVSHADVRLSLLAGHFRYTPSGLLDRTHVRFFDADSVKELLNTAGLEVLDEFEVTRDVGTTEVELPAELPDDAVTFVEADHASSVYQWVFRLAPDATAAAAPLPFIKLVRSVLEAHRALDDVTTYARGLEARIHELDPLEGQLEAARRHVNELEDVRERLAAEVAQTHGRPSIKVLDWCQRAVRKGRRDPTAHP